MSSHLFRWLALAAAVIVLSLPDAARAEPRRPNPFSVDLRLALVFPSQDPAAGFKSSAGFQLGAIGLYRVKNWLRFGGMAEWERYGVKTTLLFPPSETDIGHFNTISLLPVVELRYVDDDLPVSPYFLTGVGANLNLLQKSSEMKSISASASFDPTLAYRVAGGLDIFAGKHFGVRLEVGWKLNKGNVTVKSPILTGGTSYKTGFDASTVTATVGILLGV